jgi:hypothetical protein
MSGFIQGEDRSQATLFPERLDDYVPEDSAVRVIDAFIDELDVSGLDFRTDPNDTGRPPYHPSTLSVFRTDARPQRAVAASHRHSAPTEPGPDLPPPRAPNVSVADVCRSYIAL